MSQKQNGRISPAPIVGGKCRQVETAVENTAVIHVSKQPIEPSAKDDNVTSTNAKRNSSGGYEGICAHCRRPFVGKRASRKYCSDNCKTYAWHERRGGRPCTICGKSTGTPNNSICSDKCRMELDKRVSKRRRS